ncbi:MAG: tRNA dihydrouridine synthase DusB [Dissulfurispiraceae bacterium]|jgi:tRNA-dihydrouridine synthase B|nr:tRNA dihydrouridine synthase DusB [Dissulfurispiraceae bacterium]
MLRLGKIDIPSRCILAPLAGISDLPFRKLNRRFGCEYAFIEMVSARALVYTNRNTLKMLDTDTADRPLGLQLLGNDPEIMARAVDIVNEMDVDSIDLNAACPVNKVTSRGEGSGMLKDPSNIEAVLKAMIKKSAVPVTVKIRTGWDSRSINVVELAKRVEQAGVAALFVHGRTRQQGYSGMVDYEAIKEIKKSVSLPVAGSGDVLSAGLAKKMLVETGCDAVMIARGALGRPWIFREISAYINSGSEFSVPAKSEVGLIMLEHLTDMCSYYGEDQAVKMFRKFFGWYSKGYAGSHALKSRAFNAVKKDEMVMLIDELLQK